MKKFAMNLVAIAAIAVCGVSNAFAGGTGTLGFFDSGTPSVNTGDINSATVFTFGALSSGAAATGDFVGLGSQSYGAVSFDTTNNASLTITNTPFGTFTSTLISSVPSGATTQSYYILGKYTGGTFAGVSGDVNVDASFTVSFTQTGGSGSAISASGTFSIPPTGNPVPEPSTLALLGLGGLGLAVGAYRRRQAAV